MPSSIFKSEFHLHADNKQEESGNGILCLINISRSGIQILKVNKNLKAIGFRSFLIPYSTNDELWSEHVGSTLNSPEFKAECENLKRKYFVLTSEVILMPNALQVVDKTRLHYEFIFGESDGTELLELKLPDADMVGIQGIPTRLSELIDTTVSSSYHILINQLHTESSKTRAHLILEGKEFALVIFNGYGLEFSNWFKIDTAEDVLYYLMATLESLNILHSEIEIELSGQIDKGDEIHIALTKYLSKLSFRKRPKNLSYSYSFKDMPEHRYPFIFAAACE